MQIRHIFLEFNDRILAGDVGLSMIVTSGRNGANLLQSLLDGHPQVLMIPSIFWFYFDWELHLSKNSHDIPNLIHDFIHKSSFRADWYTTGLGSDRSQFFDMQRQDLKTVLMKMLADKNSISRRDFFVAIHVAYAVVKNINLDLIKTIVQHHHFPMTHFAKKYLRHQHLSGMFDTSIHDEDPLFSEAASDFPQLTFLHMTRNPFDSYNSMLQSISNQQGTFDIKSYYFNLYGLLAGYHEALNKAHSFPERYKLVKFEDVHLRTEDTIRSLAAFLNIAYRDCLLESTIDGKLWWGNNPKKPINGTSEKMVSDAWLQQLDQSSLAFCSQMLSRTAERLGYTPLKLYDECPAYIKNERLSWWLYFKASFTGRFSVANRIRRIIFFLMYPIQRKKLINHYMVFI